MAAFQVMAFSSLNGNRYAADLVPLKFSAQGNRMKSLSLPLAGGGVDDLSIHAIALAATRSCRSAVHLRDGRRYSSVAIAQ